MQYMLWQVSVPNVTEGFYDQQMAKYIAFTYSDIWTALWYCLYQTRYEPIYIFGENETQMESSLLASSHFILISIVSY